MHNSTAIQMKLVHACFFLGGFFVCHTSLCPLVSYYYFVQEIRVNFESSQTVLFFLQGQVSWHQFSSDFVNSNFIQVF